MKRKHHELRTWQEAISLVTDVYKITENFPKHELYLLTNQMRRAAVSIPSNIAEGAARTSNREFLNFLSIARGSLSELETQIVISKKLGYIKNENFIFGKINEVFALLGGLIRSIRNKK